MTTNLVKLLDRLEKLTEDFYDRETEDERAEFNVLNKSFLGIDLVGTLLQELGRKDKMLEFGNEFCLRNTGTSLDDWYKDHLEKLETQ